MIKGLAYIEGARERLEECQPSDEFLFGDDLKELAKAMKEENHFKGRSSSENTSFFQKKKKFGTAGGKSHQGKSRFGKGTFHKGN